MFGDEDASLMLRTPQLCATIPHHHVESLSPSFTFLPNPIQQSPASIFILGDSRTPSTPTFGTLFSTPLPPNVAFLDSEDRMQSKFADFDVQVEVEVEFITENDHSRVRVLPPQNSPSLIDSVANEQRSVFSEISRSCNTQLSREDSFRSLKRPRLVESSSSSPNSYSNSYEDGSSPAIFADLDESELSGTGSSCHQCKSRRGLDCLSFCHRMFLRHPDKEKKVNWKTQNNFMQSDSESIAIMQKEVL